MYLSSKHQSTGDLGGMKYPNRLLSTNLPLCTCNYPFYSAYKSLNHRVNFGQFKLCTDMKKNPGPSVYVDPTKTIHTPCWTTCVAISLCALIYSKITKITSVDDMTQIMIVGVQLYSSLSPLARQSMLMLTEFSGMVTVFEQFSTLNKVTVTLVTSIVIPELRGITTVYANHRVQHLKHSWH